MSIHAAHFTNRAAVLFPTSYRELARAADRSHDPGRRKVPARDSTPDRGQLPQQHGAAHKPKSENPSLENQRGRLLNLALVRIPRVRRKCSVQEQARPLRWRPDLVGRAVSPRWGATWPKCARAAWQAPRIRRGRKDVGESGTPRTKNA